MSWHKQSEAKGRWRNSIVLLLSITVASQLVGTGTQAAADPTSPASTFDFVEGTATPEGAWAVGPYAAAVIQARRQLGIVDQAEDLTQTQDDAVAALADKIVLNWLQTTTEPTLDDVNDILDKGGAPPNTTSSYGYGDYGGYGGYADLNEEEKRVCRRAAMGLLAGSQYSFRRCQVGRRTVPSGRRTQ
jgi:hypothetical protein